MNPQQIKRPDAKRKRSELRQERMQNSSRSLLTDSEQALKERMQSGGTGIAQPLPEGHDYPELEIEE